MTTIQLLSIMNSQHNVKPTYIYLELPNPLDSWGVEKEPGLLNKTRGFDFLQIPEVLALTRRILQVWVLKVYVYIYIWAQMGT